MVPTATIHEAIGAADTAIRKTNNICWLFTGRLLLIWCYVQAEHAVNAE